MAGHNRDRDHRAGAPPRLAQIQRWYLRLAAVACQRLPRWLQNHCARASARSTAERSSLARPAIYVTRTLECMTVRQWPMAGCVSSRH